MSDRSSMRVADSDRDAVAAELREHMLAGRLTSDEFEERVDRAYHASTRAELDALKVDLPLSPALLDAELAKRRSTLRRRLVQEGSGGITISAVCVAIWIADGASGSFWPAWVIIFTLLPLIRNAWRLFGPAPDLESVEAHLASRGRRGIGRESRRHHHRGLPR